MQISALVSTERWVDLRSADVQNSSVNMNFSTQMGLVKIPEGAARVKEFLIQTKLYRAKKQHVFDPFERKIYLKTILLHSCRHSH